MDNFDYKKYSLENLEKWVSDALTSGEATPQEIYDTICGVIDEEYHYHKHQTSRCYELKVLLNGGNHIGEWDKEDVEAILKEREYYEGVGNILSCDKNDTSPECQKSWNDFWEEVDEKHRREYNLREAEYYNKRAELDAKFDKDKVVKWQLPVEVDGLTGDCYVQFPDDLLEAANLKEGDTVQWVDRKDGSFELRKVNGIK
jgi:hypothetical protein